MTTQSEIPKVGDLNVKIGAIIYKQGSILDVSTSTVKQIKAQRPDGTYAWTKTASFETNGTDGKIYYSTSSASDLDQAGTWTYQAYIEIAGASLNSDPETFEVGEAIAITLTKYITYDDVLRYTGTSYDEQDIRDMIIEAESELEARISALGLTADPSSNLLKGAVRDIVTVHLLNRGRMDGSKPRQLITGNLTMMDDVDAHIEYLDTRIQSKIDLFGSLESGKYVQTGDLDQTSLEETGERADHEMPQYNLDQSTIREYHDKAEDTGNDDPDD